jgi:hypothetical protein
MKLNVKSLLMLAMPLAASFPVLADAIPYPAPGTIAPTPSITAMATGDVIGYFAGASAADTDLIRLCDITLGFCSPFTFNNQSTAVGTSFDFGAVNAGDILRFDLSDITTGQLLSSDPGVSADGINHAYLTQYSNTGAPNLGGGIPAGTFVGMEDRPFGFSDLDYNDDQFVFTNVASTTVPEPSSVLLLGTVLWLAGPTVKRKFFT